MKRQKKNLEELIEKARVAAEEKPTKANIARWKQLVRLREGPQWRRLVETKVPAKLRVKIACLVWWDFLASYPADQAKKDLDDLVAAWTPKHEVPDEKIQVALEALGYVREEAMRRARGLETR